MPIEFYYLVALIAGLAYTLCSLYIKRAMDEGSMGITRILFISKWMTFVMLLPLLWVYPHESIDWSRWWGPLLASIGAFLGWVFVLTGIRKGDVSVQTPLLGTKVLFVAIFSVFIMKVMVPFSWWIGASLAFVGILIIGLPSIRKGHITLSAIGYALISAPCFAFADVIIAQEAPKFGHIPFLLLLTAFVCLQSLLLMPFFRQKLTDTSKKRLKYPLLGAFYMALEELGIIVALALSSEPTGTNIVYNSRGIWTVLLVWLAGSFFGSKEHTHGHKIMLSRLIGAVFISAAIVIILLF